MTGKTNLPDLKEIIKFSMEGAIKLEAGDFDMTSIPEECIITDMENEENEIIENVVHI